MGATATVSVHAIRKDGFTGPIKLTLKDPPVGFSAFPVTLSGTQAVARLSVRSRLVATKVPVHLSVVGSATIQEREVSHEAVPAEDRMQAFLWRHLVPARDLDPLVFDPFYPPPPKRVARTRPRSTLEDGAAVSPVASAAGKPKFTAQQIAGRLRQLKLRFEEGLLTDDFYGLKVAECEAAR